MDHLASELKKAKNLIQDQEMREASLAQSYTDLVRKLQSLETRSVPESSGKQETETCNQNKHTKVQVDLTKSGLKDVLKKKHEDEAVSEIRGLMGRLDLLKDSIKEGFGEGKHSYQPDSAQHMQEEDSGEPEASHPPSINFDIESLKTQLKSIEQGAHILQSRILEDRDLIKVQFDVAVQRNTILEEELKKMSKEMMNLTEAQNPQSSPCTKSSKRENICDNFRNSDANMIENLLEEHPGDIAPSGVPAGMHSNLLDLAKDLASVKKTFKSIETRGGPSNVTSRLEIFKCRWLFLSRTIDSGAYEILRDKAVADITLRYLSLNVHAAKNTILKLAQQVVTEDKKPDSQKVESISRETNLLRHLLSVVQIGIHFACSSWQCDNNEGATHHSAHKSCFSALDLALPATDQVVPSLGSLLAYTHSNSSLCQTGVNCSLPGTSGMRCFFRDDQGLLYKTPHWLNSLSMQTHQVLGKSPMHLPHNNPPCTKITSYQNRRQQSTKELPIKVAQGRDQNWMHLPQFETSSADGDIYEPDEVSYDCEGQKANYAVRIEDVHCELGRKQHGVVDPESSTAQAEHLASEVSSNKEDLIHHNAALKLQIVEVENLTAELTATKAQLLGTNKILQQYSLDSAAMRETLEKLQTDLQVSKHHLDVQTKGAFTLQQQISRYKAEYHDIEKCLLEQTRLVTSRSEGVEAAKGSLCSIQAAFQECAEALVAVDKDLDAVVPKNETMRKNLHNKTIEMEDKRNQLSSEKKECVRLKEELIALEKSHEEIEAELVPSRERLTLVRMQLEEKSREVQSIATQLQSVKEELKEAEDLLQKKTDLSHDESKGLSTVEAGLGDMRIKVQAKEAQLEALKSRMSYLKSESQNCKEALDTWTSQVEEREQNINLAETGLQEYQSQLSLAQKRAHELADKLCMLKSDLLVTQQLLSQKGEAVDCLEKDVNLCTEELDHYKQLLDKRCDEFQTLSSALEVSMSDLRSSKSECTRREEEVRMMSEDLKATKIEIGAKSISKESLLESWGQLRAEVDSSKLQLESVNRQIAHNEERCRVVQEELKQVRDNLLHAQTAQKEKTEEERNLLVDLSDSNVCLKETETLLQSQTKTTMSLQQKLSSCRQKVTCIEAQLREQKIQEKNISSELDNVSHKLTPSEKELGALSEKLENDKVVLEEKLSSLQKTKASLAHKSQESAGLMDLLQQTIQDADKSKDKLLLKEKQVTELHAQLDHTRSQLEWTNETLKRKTVECEGFTRDLDQATSQLSTAQSSLELKIKEVESCTRHLTLTKAQTSQAEEAIGDASNEEVMAVQELESLNIQILQSQSSLSKKTADITNLLAKIKDKRAELDDVKAKLSVVGKEQESLSTEDCALSGDLHAMKEELASVSSLVEDIASRLTTSKADIMVTQQMLSSKSKFVASLEKDLEASQEDLKSYQEVLQRKCSESSQAEAQLGSLRDELRKAKSKIFCTEEALAPMKETVDACKLDLAKEANLVESLEAEVKQTEQELGECQHALSSTQAHVQDFRSQLGLKQKELMGMRQLLQGLEMESRSLKHQIDSVEESAQQARETSSLESNKMKADQRKLRVLESRCLAYSDSLSQRRTAIKAVEDESKRMKREYKDLRALLDADSTRCHDLSEVVQDMEEKLMQTRQDLEECRMKAVQLEASVEKSKLSLQSESEALEMQQKGNEKIAEEISTTKNAIAECCEAKINLEQKEEILDAESCTLKAQLEDNRCTLADLQEKLAKGEAHLENLRQELSKLKQVYCDKKRDTSRVALEMRSLRATFLREKSKLKDKEGDISSCKRKTKAIGEKLEQSKVLLKTKEKDLASAESVLQDAETELMLTQSQAGERQESIYKLEEKIRVAKNKIAAKRKLLSRLEKTYHKLNMDLSSRQVERERVEKNFKDQKKICQGQEHSLSSIGREVGELLSVGEDRNEVQKKQNTTLDSLQVQKQKLQHQLDQQSQKALDLAKELESQSWEVRTLKEELETKLEVCTNLKAQACSLKSLKGSLKGSIGQCETVISSVKQVLSDGPEGGPTSSVISQESREIITPGSIDRNPSSKHVNGTGLNTQSGLSGGCQLNNQPQNSSCSSTAANKTQTPPGTIPHNEESTSAPWRIHVGDQRLPSVWSDSNFHMRATSNPPEGSMETVRDSSVIGMMSAHDIYDAQGGNRGSCAASHIDVHQGHRCKLQPSIPRSQSDSLMSSGVTWPHSTEQWLQEVRSSECDQTVLDWVTSC